MRRTAVETVKAPDVYRPWDSDDFRYSTYSDPVHIPPSYSSTSNNVALVAEEVIKCVDLFTTGGILHGRAGFFEHTTTVTSTRPLCLPHGVLLKQEKPPRLRWPFLGLVGTRAHVKYVESLILQPK